MSFSRHHRQAAGPIYPESHAQAEAQPLSQPRASHRPLQIYPVVRELSADGIPVATACRVLQVSTSGFYDWRSRGPSDRDLGQAYLMNEIHDAHRASYGTYGHRRIHAELVPVSDAVHPTALSGETG